MCGIAGCVLSPGYEPALGRLSAIRDALSHRGPDGSGIEVIGNVGLVHTRLAIVDVTERARQPMRHPRGDWWLSYNGEIYNHRAIRSELTGEEFASSGDTETLLHALARWGPCVLDRLNGQFAFAALELPRRRLLLARDRFGIKPLYVARNEEGIWFASEPAALFAAGIEPTSHDQSWRSIFDWSCYPSEDTLVDNVKRLAPGTWAEIDLGSLQVTSHRWYSPLQDVDPERQRQLSSRPRRSLVEELAGTVRSAVHEALLGDVPVGTLCSGGVDSSLVTALAAEVKPGLVAFTARYGGDPGRDEGPAAQRVARALRVNIDTFEVTKPSWRSGFVAATAHFGSPIATASSVTLSQIAAHARRRGIKVLLTGEGADELFAGYMDPNHAPLANFLTPTERAVRGLEAVLTGSPVGTARAITRRAVRASRRPRGRVPARMSMRQMQAPARSAELELAYSHHTGPRRLVETTLLQEMHFTLSHLLNRMDTNLMQEAVEARVPLLDPRVVRLALNLPLEARTRPWSKGILRDAARASLPLSIAHRRKIYGMDFDAGAWIEEVASPSFLAQGMLRHTFRVPTAEFESLIADLRGNLRVRLWSAEVWCRSVFGCQSLASIEKELWPHGP
jgi:asparagine synthase (glutamine-hydrolysing)